MTSGNLLGLAAGARWLRCKPAPLRPPGPAAAGTRLRKDGALAAGPGRQDPDGPPPGHSEQPLRENL